MSVIPAKTQQVRYSTDMGGGENPFLTLLSAFGTGMMQKNQAPQQQFQSAFPTLAQMKMVKPVAQGTPGAMPYAGGWWQPQAPGQDYGDENARLLAQERGLSLGLPGYNPTDTYLQKEAMEEANNDPGIKSMGMLYGLQAQSAVSPEAQAKANALQQTYLTKRDELAKNIFAKKKAGYDQTVAATTTAKRIKVKKGSQEFTVPEDQLEEALRQGYTKA